MRTPSAFLVQARPCPIFGRPVHRRGGPLSRPARHYPRVRIHEGLIAHRFLPLARRLSTAGSHRVSRFSHVEFLCMPGVFDSAGPAARSRCRAPQCGLPVVVTPSAPCLTFFGAHYFGIPSLLMPLSNPSLRPYSVALLVVTFQRFQCALTVRTGMARGQDGSLLLSCVTLSFTTPRRFIPTLSTTSVVPAIIAGIQGFSP